MAPRGTAAMRINREHPLRLFCLLVFLSVLSVATQGCIETNERVGCVETHVSDIRYVDPIFQNVDVTPDLVYGQAVNVEGTLQELFLDVYEPAGDTEPERPAFVFAVGGGFRNCNHKSDGAVLVASEFARRGYVAVSITYRVRPEIGDLDPFLYPEIVRDASHDMLAAVRWLRANAGTYRIDTNRIVVSGSSAGAITSLTANATADDPGDSGNPGYSSETAAAVSLSGALFQTNLLESGEGPIFLAHGTRDPRVPFLLAYLTCVRADTVEVDYSLWTYDAEHSLWDFTDEIIANAAEFLYCRII